MEIVAIELGRERPAPDRSVGGEVAVVLAAIGRAFVNGQIEWSYVSRFLTAKSPAAITPPAARTLSTMAAATGPV